MKGQGTQAIDQSHPSQARGLTWILLMIYFITDTERNSSENKSPEKDESPLSALFPRDRTKQEYPKSVTTFVQNSDHAVSRN